MTLGQYQYDVLGRQVLQVNPLDGPTSTGYASLANGQLQVTTTYPDLGTRVETYYCDGRLQSVTGTAIQPVRYEYGVESPDSGYYREYTKEIKQKDGSDSQEWIKTYVDGAGRQYEIVFAPDGEGSKDYFCNTQGQLWKEQDPDGVITFHTFNAKGEPEYTITAVSATARGITDYDALRSTLPTLLDGPDRIIRTVRSIVPAADGKADLLRTDTCAWLDGQSSGTLVSRSEVSTDGLQTWQTTWRDTSTPATTHTQVSYGANGARTVTATAPGGSRTVSAYSNGQFVSVTRRDSTGAQIGGTSYGYDPHGRQSTAADARNGTTTTGYNAADLITTVTTPNPGTPGGAPQTTTTSYNNMLQAIGVQNPDGTTVTSEYYPTGALKRQYGSRTYPVGYSYDYAGRLKTMTNWSGFTSGAGARVTTWNYNPCRGWLESKRFPDNKGPDYTYTPGGRLKTRTWARTGTGANRITTTYTYAFENGGGSGDFVQVDYSNDSQGTPSVNYTPDRLGRPYTVACNGITTTLAFNLAGEPLSESCSGGTLDGVSVSSAYDEYLRRTGLSAQYSSTPLLHHSSAYDYASRLQTVTDNTGSPAYSANYTYLANSPLVSQITFQQASTTRMTTTKQHDYLNRLSSIASSFAASALVSSAYAYNNANQRVRSTLADGSYWVYTYDALGQVVSGHKYWFDQTPVAGQQFDYAFDDIGNRTQTQAGGDETGANQRSANYSANTLNQYTSRGVPGAVDIMGISLAANTVTVNGQTAYRKGEYFRKELPVSNGSAPVWESITVHASGQTDFTGHELVPRTPEQFGYDDDGNLLSDGRWNYTWDAENRLVKVSARTSTGPQISLRFEYDWKGRRIRKQVWPNTAWSDSPTNDLKFVYDGWNLIAELDALNASTLLRSYVWGLDLSGTLEGAGGVGGLLFIGNHASPIGYYSTAHDGNGNVMALISMADGTPAAQYEYGPFGELIRATGPMARANPFRFSTKYQDDETDLLYYGYRSYNANTGRWLSRDPIGERGGGNLYLFAGNRALNAIDLLGLKVWIYGAYVMQAEWGEQDTISLPGTFTIGYPFSISVDIQFGRERVTPITIEQKSGKQPGEVDPPKGMVWLNEPVIYKIVIDGPNDAGRIGVQTWYGWSYTYYRSVTATVNWKRAAGCPGEKL